MEEVETYDRWEDKWRRSDSPYSVIIESFPQALPLMRRTIKRNLARVQHRIEILKRHESDLDNSIWTSVMPDHRWFWRNVVEYFFQEPRKQLEQERKNLTRDFMRISPYARTRHHIMPCDIDTAKTSPLSLWYPGGLIRRGERQWGICPFHQGDTTPSFCWYVSTNSFYCFGCHAAGDVISFMQKYYHYSFHEAVRKLTTSLCPISPLKS